MQTAFVAPGATVLTRLPARSLLGRLPPLHRPLPSSFTRGVPSRRLRASSFIPVPSLLTSSSRRTTPVAPSRSSLSMSTSSTTPEPTMARASHILVDSEELLDTVRDQLSSGQEFGAVARLVSKCPSKERGGDLGWFRRNVMVKEFEQAAFSNAPGSVVKVRTEFGWHLIRVEDHATPSTTITVQEFAVRFVQGDESDKAQFIDCREKGELDLATIPAPAPTFLNLAMGEYEQWVEDFEAGTLGLDKEKETVVMCHHGMRSANFCSFLTQNGFTKVRNLSGGIHGYAKQIDSSVPTYGD